MLSLQSSALAPTFVLPLVLEVPESQLRPSPLDLPPSLLALAQIPVSFSSGPNLSQANYRVAGSPFTTTLGPAGGAGGIVTVTATGTGGMFNTTAINHVLLIHPF